MDKDKEKQRTRARLGSQEVDLEKFAEIINQLPPDYEGQIPIPTITPSAETKHEPPPPPSAPEKLPPAVRSPIVVEQQLFGDVKHKAEQLWIFEAGASPEVARQKGSDVTGLDLSLTDQMALHGLAVLLAKTGYKGNVAPDNPITLLGDGLPAPRIRITLPEFYEACGAKRNKEGKYQGKAIMDLRRALFDSLAQDQMLCFSQKYWDSRGHERVRVLQGPVKLIRVTNFYDLSKKEYEEIKDKLQNGQVEHSKVREYIVTYHPLIIYEIDSFYSLIPVTLYQDIKKILPGYRGRVVPLFIRFLLTLDRKVLKKGYFKISQEVLAQKLKLGYLLEPKRPGSGPQKRRLKEQELGRCFKVAKELGFLLDIKEEYTDKLFYLFKLNPDKCPRLKLKQDQLEVINAENSS